MPAQTPRTSSDLVFVLAQFRHRNEAKRKGNKAILIISGTAAGRPGQPRLASAGSPQLAGAKHEGRGKSK